ncbi:hypothetical protein FLM69_08735 [Micrococcus sp. R8502A1]|nr:hypothetical protein FLM69_08735 [Micrococcus sp. R8502A1]
MNASATSAPTRSRSSLFSGVPWVLLGTAVYMLSMAGLTFFLPRFVSPEEFGLWQVYQFYALYLGYLTFGYSDGVLLRLAGLPRADFPSRELSVGLASLVVTELLFFGSVVLVLGLGTSFLDDGILLLAIVGVLFYIPRVLITFLHQAAGDARMVACTTLIERLVLLIGFVVFVMAPDLGLPFLLAADVAGKVAGFGFALWSMRDVLLGRPLLTTAALRQFVQDCRDGAFVVLSNASTIALNGATRAVIGGLFGTVVFGQLSLALQVSTVLLVIINAVAVAVFPNVKRLGAEELANAYRTLRVTLVGPAALSLVACWPLAWILGQWIPDYALAIDLMVFLFPVGYFEIKSRGVLAVLLKSLRRERTMFWINLVAALLGAGSVYAMSVLTGDVAAALAPFVLIIALRTLVLEHVVSSSLSTSTVLRSGLDLGLMLLHYTLYTFQESPAGAVLAALTALSNVGYAWLLIHELRGLRQPGPAAPTATGRTAS